MLKTDAEKRNNEEEMSSFSDNDDEEDSLARQNNRKEKVERSKLKFPTTESTQKLFRQFESGITLHFLHNGQTTGWFF